MAVEIPIVIVLFFTVMCFVAIGSFVCVCVDTIINIDNYKIWKKENCSEDEEQVGGK